MTATRLNPVYAPSALGDKLKYGSDWTAMQVQSGQTVYRWQLNLAGNVTLYKSTDGGASWTNEGHIDATKMQKTSVSVATNTTLYVSGHVATLVLNGYRTQYAHSAGEYDTSKAEFTVPSGYRPNGQVYATMNATGGRLCLDAGGKLMVQGAVAVAANTALYASFTYVIA